MVESGMVYREQGHGTFVVEPKMREVTGFSSFSEGMIANGMQPSSIVITQALIGVDERPQKALKIGPEDRALHLVRFLFPGKFANQFYDSNNLNLI